VDGGLRYESHTSTSLRREMLLTSSKLGYGAVFWNQIVTGRITKELEDINLVDLEETDEESKGKNKHSKWKRGGRNALRITMRDNSNKFNNNEAEIAQYKRLTVVLDHTSKFSDLSVSNKVLERYDVLAAQPMTDRAFKQCCQSLEIDIISLDLSARLPFKIKLPNIKQAFSRGIFFELSIGQSLRDISSRRYFLSHMLMLVKQTKGRNIIMSSDANKVMHLRAPRDLMNIGVLLGIKENVAKTTVSDNCYAILDHARARKSEKGVFEVFMLRPEDKGSWELPTFKTPEKTLVEPTLMTKESLEEDEDANNKPSKNTNTNNNNNNNDNKNNNNDNNIAKTNITNNNNNNNNTSTTTTTTKRTRKKRKRRNSSSS